MIPIYRPYLHGREKEYVAECMDSTWISSRGEFIGRFESAFADFTGAAHAISVSNGTVAIHVALDALGIGPGDEVIVPSFTYVASVNPILQLGARPVYAESLEATWQIDPEDVRRKITSRTKAIIAVHLYGLPCDMESLTSICAEHGLLLFEDCAEAFGTRYQGRHVGTFGDAASFSFFGNKTITTGEGGMVVARDAALARRIAHLKSQGVSPDVEYRHDTLAYNYRMTNLCAAIGVAQLEQADRILALKRDVASRYRENLKGLPLVFHDEVPGTVHSYWMCSIAVAGPKQRDTIRAALRAKGVETRPAFFPVHQMPHTAADCHLPVAESLSSRGINLPSYPDLNGAEVDFICGIIADTIR